MVPKWSVSLITKTDIERKLRGLEVRKIYLYGDYWENPHFYEFRQYAKTRHINLVNAE